MAIILDIDHEAGNTSEYYDTSGKISVVAAAALAGTNYGLKAIVDDTTVDYAAVFPIDSSGTWRHRFYFNADNIVLENTKLFNIYVSYKTGYSSNFYVALQNDSGYKLRMYYGTDAGTQVDASYAISGGEHYVEILYTKSSAPGANNGTFYTWIDGVAKSAKTGLDNDVIASDLYYVRVGGTSNPGAGACSGDLYIDQIVINNDGSAIGALVVPSASVSPSLSPSSSASLSLSPSSSVSKSISPSASVSRSLSPSSSVSPSPSVTYIYGETTWGHITSVVEDNVRTFATNWSGTGNISGAGDSETMCVTPIQYMESEIIQTNPVSIELLINNYQAGDTATIKYRTGATGASCQGASWISYTVPFESLGFVQVRIEG